MDFETPRVMPPLPNSEKRWKSVGYFQTFYCTEKSKEKAKKLVHQYFLENEENPPTCQFKYDRIAWMRDLTDIEDLTHGYDSELTEEMFANRDKIGIWYSGKKEYYMSEEDYTAEMIDEEFNESDELNEDEYCDGYEGQCQACDEYGPMDDMSLCNECAGKLERDLIRQRDWEYSASAFGLTNELCEKLRSDVIKKFGNELELIAPSRKKKKSRKKSKRRQKKK
ncbi:hypothetical protein ACFL7M_18335 [Thermodesulfobacteriota bacterium]